MTAKKRVTKSQRLARIAFQIGHMGLGEYLAQFEADIELRTWAEAEALTPSSLAWLKEKFREKQMEAKSRGAIHNPEDRHCGYVDTRNCLLGGRHG